MNFALRTLPGRELSPNSISGSEGKRRQVNKERQRLRAETAVEIQAAFGTDIPAYKRAIVDITLVHSFKRPGDEYYRPTDCDNVPVKGVIDGLVDMGVLPDDKWTHVPAQIKRIEKCQTLQEEHYLIHVEPLL